MEYVLIGKIVNTFGLRGELKIDSYTDFAKERFKKGSDVYVGEEYLPFKVSTFREHKGFLLVSFKDNEDINLVEKFKNMLVYKCKEDIKPLKKGEYYFSDIKGLEVYIAGQHRGKVVDMEEGIRNNNMRILSDADHKEHLVPFLEQFVLDVDLKEGRIDIVDMEGLL